MRLTEFYPEKQGRPESKVALDMDQRGPSIPVGYITGIMLQSSYSIIEQTNNYTASNYTLILADAGGGPITVTLPPALTSSGRYYIIKKVDGSANAVRIEPDTSTELIDGESFLTLSLQYQYTMVCCSGVLVGDSYWHVIGGGNVKIEELLSNIGGEQINLLSQLLNELRQIKLHEASMSDADVDAIGVQED